jgi:hypothetical protein
MSESLGERASKIALRIREELGVAFGIEEVASKLFHS